MFTCSQRAPNLNPNGSHNHDAFKRLTFMSAKSATRRADFILYNSTFILQETGPISHSDLFALRERALTPLAETRTPLGFQPSSFIPQSF